MNLVRYHGVLAPHAKDRDKIVPAGEKAVSDPASGAETDRPEPRSYRLAWAALLARILETETRRTGDVFVRARPQRIAFGLS